MALAPPGGHVPHRRSQGLRASGADGVWDARLGDVGVRLRGLRGCAVWELLRLGLRGYAVWGAGAARLRRLRVAELRGCGIRGFAPGLGSRTGGSPDGRSGWEAVTRSRGGWRHLCPVDPAAFGGGYPIAWGLAAFLARRLSQTWWRLPEKVAVPAVRCGLRSHLTAAIATHSGNRLPAKRPARPDQRGRTRAASSGPGAKRHSCAEITAKSAQNCHLAQEAHGKGAGDPRSVRESGRPFTVMGPPGQCSCAVMSPPRWLELPTASDYARDMGRRSVFTQSGRNLRHGAENGRPVPFRGGVARQVGFDTDVVEPRGESGRTVGEGIAHVHGLRGTDAS